MATSWREPKGHAGALDGHVVRRRSASRPWSWRVMLNLRVIPPCGPALTGQVHAVRPGPVEASSDSGASRSPLMLRSAERA